MQHFYRPVRGPAGESRARPFAGGGTGSCLGGLYFWCSDLVIVRRPGLRAMADAIRDLIDTGEITSACSLLP